MSFRSGSKGVHLYLSGLECADLPGGWTRAGGEPPGEVPASRPRWPGHQPPRQVRLTCSLVLKFERLSRNASMESLFLPTTFQDSKVEHHVLFCFAFHVLSFSAREIFQILLEEFHISPSLGDKKTIKQFPLNNQGFFFLAG